MKHAQIEELLRSALASSKADETFITINALDTTSFPFSCGIPLQAFFASGCSYQATLRFGNRSIVVQGNLDDSGSLKQSMNDAAQLVALKAPDDVQVPVPGPVTVRESAMSAPLPADMITWCAESVREILSIASAAQLNAFGSLSISETTTMLGSSRGLFLKQPATSVQTSIQMMNRSGSSNGFASGRGLSPSDLNVRALAKRAADKCVAWKNAKEVKFDRMTTVFEAQAFSEIMMQFIEQFDYEAIDQNRSFLRKMDGSNRIGTEMFNDTVTISSDPYHKQVPASPFSPEGIEIKPIEWVSKGKIMNAVKTPYYVAKHLGGEVVPFPSNLIMPGGDESLDSIIGSTDHGLLVSGFTSFRIEDATSCLLNASTQGGLFMIKDGKIAHAVKNVVFREKPVYLLLQKEVLGAPERVFPKGFDFPMLVPPLRVKDVLYSGLSGII